MLDAVLIIYAVGCAVAFFMSGLKRSWPFKAASAALWPLVVLAAVMLLLAVAMIRLLERLGLMEEGFFEEGEEAFLDYS